MTVIAPINPREFNLVVQRLRQFFLGRDFVEVHTGNRLSILAACEDPRTIGTFSYAGRLWSLPQTGQMDLEEELLRDPTLPGVFCVSTSFRQEPNPIPGRHDLIFPMFEFEAPGGIDELRKVERDLLAHLGFGTDTFMHGVYADILAKFGLKMNDFIDAEVEGLICERMSPTFFLEFFPRHTSPFWNMLRQPDDTAAKIDVILYGVETVGSAARSCDPTQMRESFMTISGGEYSDLLFAQFGRDRVLAELDAFLNFRFFPRFGGGIGLTRLIRAMKLAGLMDGLKQGRESGHSTTCSSCRASHECPVPKRVLADKVLVGG